MRAEERQRQRFSELLAQALPDPRLRTMMSMRSDFLGGLQNDEPLFKAHRQIDVPPLREAELREVVSRPAELLSARFETAGLVDIITRRTAEDSVKDVGALPLLSYTLDDMWTQMVKRGDGMLRLPAAILRTWRRARRPRQHVSGGASGRRGCAAARADAAARDRARGRRADAAARAHVRSSRRRNGGSSRSLPTIPIAFSSRSPPRAAKPMPRSRTRRSSGAGTSCANGSPPSANFWPGEAGSKPRAALGRRRRTRSKNDALLMGFALAQAQSWLNKRCGDISENDREFIRQSVAREKKTQIRATRGRVLVYVLLVCIIAGLIGWINQVYMAAQLRWWTVTYPYMVSQVRPYVLSAAKEQALKQGDSFKECAQDCPEMIVVPVGSFTMGNPTNISQRPQHTVTFSNSLAVAKYELTFADWDACVAGGGCNGYEPFDEDWGREQQPVINVNWHDAEAYVAWLSTVTGRTYRLLSEAEYEYSMRAGTTTEYPWGDDIKLNGQPMADCDGCGSKWDNQRTAPVGSFAANKFGLFDMVGNVMSWTEDCVHQNYNGAPGDGSAWLEANSGDCSARVLRGGSWDATPVSLSFAVRGGYSSETRSTYIGVRVARTLSAVAGAIAVAPSVR